MTLVTRAQLDHVVQDHFVDGDLYRNAVTKDDGPWGGEDGEAVQRPFRPNLLHDAHSGVGGHHDPEEGVLRRAHDDDYDQERAQDGVEPGGDVAPDDHPDRPARTAGLPVDLACVLPERGLARGEPPEVFGRRADQAWGCRGHERSAAAQEGRTAPCAAGDIGRALSGVPAPVPASRTGTVLCRASALAALPRIALVMPAPRVPAAMRS